MDNNEKKKNFWPWIKLSAGVIVFAVLANIVYNNNGRTLTAFVPKEIPAGYALDKSNSLSVTGETRGVGYLVHFTGPDNKIFTVTTYQSRSEVNEPCEDGDTETLKEVKNIDLANAKVCTFIYENKETKEKYYYLNKGENTIRILDMNTPYLELSIIEKIINSLEAKQSTNI